MRYHAEHQTAHLPHIMDYLDVDVLHRFPCLRTFAADLGRTPLIEVPSKPGAGRILAKCEWYNPSGSVKDRVAFAMLYQLLSTQPDANAANLHVLEYSGGSLAVSLSKLCAEAGIRCTLVLSSHTSPATVQAMEREGSEIILVDKDKGFWAVMECTMRMAEQHPDYSFLYQHSNDANLWVHRNTTGSELLVQLSEQTPAGALSGLRPDAWIASIGTGGTLIGVYEALSTHFPGLRLYAVTPAEMPYGTEQPPNGLPKIAGSGGLGSGRKQPFVARNEDKIAKHFTYSFDESLAALRVFADQTNLRIGTSAAANWLAALEVAEELGIGGVVVTVFPSLATPDEWAKAQAGMQS